MTTYRALSSRLREKLFILRKWVFLCYYYFLSKKFFVILKKENQTHFLSRVTTVDKFLDSEIYLIWKSNWKGVKLCDHQIFIKVSKGVSEKKRVSNLLRVLMVVFEVDFQFIWRSLLLFNIFRLNIIKNSV